MPQSLAKILVHLIFSTKNRISLIEPEIEGQLYPYMATACRSCQSPAIKVGGTGDHIHIVCSLHRTVSVADLVGTVKADSSKWMKTNGPKYGGFAWQNGYGAFSLGESQLDTVEAYITRQKQHHKQRTFQEEFREFLTRYQVEYDERYVWD